MIIGIVVLAVLPKQDAPSNVRGDAPDRETLVTVLGADLRRVPAQEASSRDPSINVAGRSSTEHKAEGNNSEASYL